jgi:CheY-like chemotaxis protein
MLQFCGGAETALRYEALVNVLLADDNAAIRLLLRAQLEALSLDVLEAADGQAALDLARAEHPRIAVLDLQMPKLNGFEVCTRLKADEATRDISVFILTGNDEDDVRAYAFAAGADYFFAKSDGTRAVCQQIVALLSR